MKLTAPNFLGYFLRYFLVYFLVPTLVVVLYPNVLSAEPPEHDPLSNILTSRDFVKKTRIRRRRANATSLQYAKAPHLTEGTNLFMIFDDENRGRLGVFGWISPPSVEYRVDKLLSKPEPTHMTFTTSYHERKSNKKFDLTILIPHPLFYPMVDSSLIPEFNAFKNPTDTVGTSEANISGLTAKIFYRESGCSVIMSTVLKVLVNVEISDSCADLDPIRRFLRALNFQRFNHEIQSADLHSDESEKR